MTRWMWQVADRWVCRHCGVRKEWDWAEMWDGQLQVGSQTRPVSFGTVAELADHYRLRHPAEQGHIDYLTGLSKSRV